MKLQPPIARRDPEPENVAIVRRRADADRRARLVRLLAMLLDKPSTPDDRR